MIIIGKISRDLGKPSPISSVQVLKVFALLRVLRVLRPIKALTFLPFVINYIQAVIISAKGIMLNAILLAFSMICLALLTSLTIGDRLSFRCVPNDLTNPNVLNDPNYIDYGLDFYNSEFNYNLCGSTYVQNSY